LDKAEPYRPKGRRRVVVVVVVVVVMVKGSGNYSRSGKDEVIV